MNYQLKARLAGGLCQGGDIVGVIYVFDFTIVSGHPFLSSQNKLVIGNW